jgi:glutamate racemase
VFDSGIGGGTVLRELRALLPAERLVYLADQAYCPYGPRPVAEIRERSRLITRWLLAHNAKAIVVACNSASAAALHTLREEFPATAFIGMVPAVKPAALHTRSGVIGVLATTATAGGAMLRTVIAQWAPGVRVLAQPCPALVELVERGELDTPHTREVLAGYVEPLLQAGADTLVLGCTHFPFLLPQLRQVAGPAVELLDPAPAIARQTRRVLAERNLLHPGSLPGLVEYTTTGDAGLFGALVERLALPPGSIHAAGAGLVG